MTTEPKIPHPKTGINPPQLRRLAALICECHYKKVQYAKRLPQSFIVKLTTAQVPGPWRSYVAYRDAAAWQRGVQDTLAALIKDPEEAANWYQQMTELSPGKNGTPADPGEPPELGANLIQGDWFEGDLVESKTAKRPVDPAYESLLADQEARDWQRGTPKVQNYE